MDDVWSDTVEQCLDGRVSAVDVPPAVKIHSIDVEMEPRFTETPVHVLDMDAIDAAVDCARKGYRVLLLNYCSIEAPGEEEYESVMFYRSNYFKSLLQDYYPLAPTDVVFSPGVCFFKDTKFRDLSSGNLIDCIAGSCGSLEAIEMVFKTGYAYGHDVLVLYCPRGSAEAFRDIIHRFEGCFRAIIFVASPEDVDYFNDVFNSTATENSNVEPPEQPIGAPPVYDPTPPPPLPQTHSIPTDVRF